MDEESHVRSRIIDRVSPGGGESGCEIQPSRQADVRTNASLFPNICLATAIVALLACLWQTDFRFGNIAFIALAYSVPVVISTCVTLVFYVYFNRFFVPPLRQLPASEFYLGWQRNYLRTMPWMTTLVAYVGLLATQSSFTVYKAQVLPQPGFLYYELFANMDRWLFLGNDPWVITHELFPSAFATWFIDLFFHQAFLPMLLGFTLCIWIRGYQALRFTYMATYLVAWVLIGMFLAQAMISAGPLYDGLLWGDGARFGALIERLNVQDEGGGPFFFLEAKDYLYQKQVQDKVAIGGGISAMPSMHVALAVMWALAGWAVTRWLGWISASGLALRDRRVIFRPAHCDHLDRLCPLLWSLAIGWETLTTRKSTLVRAYFQGETLSVTPYCDDAWRASPFGGNSGPRSGWD